MRHRSQVHSRPLVSIVTPSYNQGQFIERTIKSVLDQDYSPIEYIVVDGCSTDATCEVLDRYRDRISTVVSEPDEGQADAIDKGFAMARGELVGWINSDDVLEPQAVSRIVAAWKRHPDASMLYGDVYVIDENDQRLGELRPPNCVDYDLVLNGPSRLVQPGSFYPRELVDRVGGVRKDYYLMMDKELWLRLSQEGPGYHVRSHTASFRRHGGAKTHRPTGRHIKERLLIRQTHRPRLISHSNLGFAKICIRYLLTLIRR